MKKTEFYAKHNSKILSVISKKKIGIIGAGGIGSNAAVSLARAGVGHLVIADFDIIQPSNLNRQYYFLDQIEKPKVFALEKNLKKINPFISYRMINSKINELNLAEFFFDVDLLIEAVDRADQKKMILESWIELYPNKPIVMASGIAGIGGNNMLHTRKIDNIYICGDEKTESDESNLPYAPKVAMVAAMQANLALEILLGAKNDR